MLVPLNLSKKNGGRESAVKVRFSGHKILFCIAAFYITGLQLRQNSFFVQLFSLKNVCDIFWEKLVALLVDFWI